MRNSGTKLASCYTGKEKVGRGFAGEVSWKKCWPAKDEREREWASRNEGSFLSFSSHASTARVRDKLDSAPLEKLISAPSSLSLSPEDIADGRLVDSTRKIVRVLFFLFFSRAFVTWRLKFEWIIPAIMWNSIDKEENVSSTSTNVFNDHSRFPFFFLLFSFLVPFAKKRRRHSKIHEGRKMQSSDMLGL